MARVCWVFCRISKEHRERSMSFLQRIWGIHDLFRNHHHRLEITMTTTISTLL